MCVWNSMRVWISYQPLWQKWHSILVDKISCKHYPKWNAYTCPSKYWVILKCRPNETSCEQDLFLCRFEISNRYEFILPLVWTYSKINEKIETIISCYYGEMPNVKAHRQISKKQCFEKYCLCDKACQFSALQCTHWWNYLENLTIDDKFINKRVRNFIWF